VHSNKKILLLTGAILLTVSLRGWCQANVNEGLETAVLYVDGANGSDNNPGTESQPLQTIGKSVSLAQANNSNDIGTRVIINPGVYREAVNISYTSQMTNMPITFEAAVNGTVMVSGAQQWTSWQPYSGNSNIYTSSWPYTWGLCPEGADATPWPDIVMRQEMVLVNGQLLTQVLSLNEMTVSTFYVDVTGGKLYVWPPKGSSINSSDVEVAVNPTIWEIQGFSNLVMRGLTFEYANSCRENGAVLVEGGTTDPVSNILFDADNFVWNNAQGLNMEPVLSDVTVQSSVADHNGEAGIQSTHSMDFLFQNDSASYNNWRGAWGAYYNFNSGGFHFYQMHETTLNDVDLTYNQTYGVHFDTDHQNLLVDDMISSENLLVGALIERNEGPFTVENSFFCNGNPTSSTNSNAGMDVRDSEYLTATGNYFVNNALGNIYINGVDGGYQFTNWETGQLTTVFDQYLTMTQNTLVDGASQPLFSDNFNWDWPYFEPTLISNYNTWWNSADTEPFTIPEGATQTINLSFSGWQGATGQDLQSAWSQPSSSSYTQCNQEPDIVDYWFLTPYNVASQTVSAGGSVVWPVSIFPLLFTSNVNLTYDVSMVPGATASYAATVLAPGASTNFTINTSKTTPAGTYQIVMIANSGNLTKAITALLTVN